MTGDVEVELAARVISSRSMSANRIASPSRPGPASTSPSGLMMQLPPVLDDVVGRLRQRVWSVPGKSRRQVNWLQAARSSGPRARRAALSIAMFRGHRRSARSRSDVFGVHRHSEQRHVVLPADHGTDPAERSVEHRHRRPVPEPPHNPSRRRPASACDACRGNPQTRRTTPRSSTASHRRAQPRRAPGTAGSRRRSLPDDQPPGPVHPPRHRSSARN